MGKKKGKGKKGTKSTAQTLEQFVGPRAVINKATAHLPTAPRPKTEEELNRPQGYRGGGRYGSDRFGAGGAEAEEPSAADSDAKWRRGQPVGGSGGGGGFGGGGFGAFGGEQGEDLGPSQADTSNQWRGGRAAASSGGGGVPQLGGGGFPALESNEADTAQQWRGGRAAHQPQSSPFGGSGPRAVEPDLPSGSWRRTQPAAAPAATDAAMFPSAADATQNWRGSAAAAQGSSRFGGGGGLSRGPVRGTASASYTPEPDTRFASDSQPWRGGGASSPANAASGGRKNRFSSLMDSAGPSQSVRPVIQLKQKRSPVNATTSAPAATAAAATTAAGSTAPPPGGSSKWTPRPKATAAATAAAPQSAAPAAKAAAGGASGRPEVSGWTPKNPNAPSAKRSDENRPPSGGAPSNRFGASKAANGAAPSNRFGAAKPKAAASSAAASSSAAPPRPQPGSWAPRNPNVRKPTSTPSAAASAASAPPSHQIVRPKVSAKPKSEGPKRTALGSGGGLFGNAAPRSDPSGIKRTAGGAAASGGVSRFRPSIAGRSAGAAGIGARSSLNPSRGTERMMTARQKANAKELEEKKEKRDKQSQFETVLSTIEVNEDLVEKDVFESGIKALDFDKTPAMRAPMVTLAVRLVHEAKLNVKQLNRMFTEAFAPIAHELMLELLLEGKEKMGEKTLESKVRVQQKKKFDLHAALKIDEKDDADVEAWFVEKGLACLKPKVDVASLLVKNAAKSPAELVALIKENAAVDVDAVKEAAAPAPAAGAEDAGGDEDAAAEAEDAVVVVAAPPPALERAVAREASRIVFEKYFAGKCDASILEESHELLALVVANSNDNACEILLQAEKAWIGTVPDNKNAKPNLDKPALATLFEALYRAKLATLNSMGAWRLVKPSKKKVFEGKAKLQALMATASVIQTLEDEEEEERQRIEDEAIEAGEELDEDIPGFERNQNYDD